MKRIYLTVEGGAVTGVEANFEDQDLELVLIDHDVEGMDGDAVVEVPSESGYHDGVVRVFGTSQVSDEYEAEMDGIIKGLIGEAA